MSQCRMRTDLLLKPGSPHREEMPTIQVKNTPLHLNGQNLALASKNRAHLEAPGLHLSPAPVKEAAGRLTASPQLTHEGTAQLDMLPSRTPRLALGKASENHPSRRPLKLAPLDLSEEIRQAQTQKLKCSLNVKAKVKTSVPQSREKTSSLEFKKPSKAPIKKCMEDVVCQGTQAPLLPKLTPHSPHVKARIQVSTGPNLANQDNTGKRRLRLTREHCLEEDEAKSNVSTTAVALCSNEDKLAKDVRGRVQMQDRGNPQSGKGIRGLPVVPRANPCVKKSNGEDGQSRLGTCTLGEQDSELEGGSAASQRLKRKKVLMTNKTLTLERLQL